MVWLPSTAVGDGGEPGGEDGAGVATELAVAAGSVGDPDCAAEGATAADGFAEVGVA